MLRQIQSKLKEIYSKAETTSQTSENKPGQKLSVVILASKKSPEEWLATLREECGKLEMVLEFKPEIDRASEEENLGTFFNRMKSLGELPNTQI